MKLNSFLFISFISFLLFACSQPIVKFNKSTIFVELAQTPFEWQQGLQQRTFLASNEGMLFVFPQERTQVFWMKDTLISLDMLFIAQNGTVTAIYKNVHPCVNAPCSTYAGLGKYVLEVNAGTANAQGITIGDLVEIRI